MAHEPRNVRYYAERIAEERKMDKEVVNTALLHAWRAISAMVTRKEDVRLPKLGRLYFEKKPMNFNPDNHDNDQHAIKDGKGVVQPIQQRGMPWDTEP